MASEYIRGEMDIREQVATFHLFYDMVKWGSLAISALVLLFAVWFCTPAGFPAGFGAASALTVVGVLLLRDKASAAH